MTGAFRFVATKLWVGLQADGFHRIEAEGVGLKPDPQGVARSGGSAFRPTGFAASKRKASG
jgi:hypothetical protein